MRPAPSHARLPGATLPTLTGIAVLFATPGYAEPVQLPIQGRLSATGGGAVTDGGYPMAIGLFDAAAAGKQLHDETFLNVPVAGGLFALALGGGKTKLDSDVLTTGAGGVWIGVTVAGEPELPRIALQRVPYAVHALAANMAGGLQCSGCVDAGDLAAGAVTGDKIATGAVQSAHVAFGYAGSADKGGSATHALTATQAKSAETAAQAKAADFAATADEAKVANSAQKLACTGCVAAGMLADAVVGDLVAAKKLGLVAASGKYTDLVGAPDLAAYGGLAAANTWAAPQTLDKGAALGAALDFKTHEAVSFRFQNSSGPPVKCDAKLTGLAYYDTKANNLAVCDGKDYVPFAFAVPPGSDNNPGKSCLAIYEVGIKQSAAYWVDPDGSAGPLEKIQVACDMEGDGGGWTLVANAHPTGNQHVATTGSINLGAPVGVPWEDAPAGRKQADAWIKGVATEGTIRVQVGAKQTPKYRTFFRLPAGIANLNFTCKGSGCPRIITSHSYPYQWESSACTGVGKGYNIASDNYWVFDNHDNGECGAQFSSSKYNAGERVLYYYTPSPGGIYQQQAGYTWVR